MNQYSNMAAELNKSTFQFDPKDARLLKELIERTPGVKNVNGHPKVLSALWDELTIQYNKRATECRDAATLRRKYKSFRDTFKKRMKVEARTQMRKSRLGLDSGNGKMLPEQSPGYGYIAIASNYIPEGGLSIPNKNIRGSDSNINFGKQSYDGELSTIQNAYAPGRSNYSAPAARNPTPDHYKSSDNNVQRQTNLKRSYPEDDFDLFQQDKDNHSHHEEEIHCGDAGHASNASSEIDLQLAELRREKLTAEITYRREEHESHMSRMYKYHAMKINEVKGAMQLQRSKHTLEMQYLKLKIRQCNEGIDRESPIRQSEDSIPVEEIQHAEQQEQRNEGVVDLTAEETGHVAIDNQGSNCSGECDEN